MHHIVVGTDRKKYLLLNGGSLRHLLVHHLERDIVHVKRHVALVLDFCVEIQQVAVYIDALQKVLDSETIGDMCFIAPGVILTCAGHPVVAEQRNLGLETSKPITIGNRVWIGADATIYGGVTIGDHAVIGAGAVVLHDVPDNTIVAGVPAKEIRKITDKDIIPSDEILF